MKFVYKMFSCGGCRTCEMACSYREHKTFSFDDSCIRILEADQGNGYSVSFMHPEGYEDNPCLVCINEQNEPLCIQFCNEPQELTDILHRYVKEIEEK